MRRNPASCSSGNRLRAAIVVAGSLGSTNALAEPISIQPRISVGVQDYRLEFSDVLTPLADGSINFRDGFEVRDRMPFAGAGLTLARGRWFVDVAGQWSREGSDRGEQFQGATQSGGFGQNHTLDSRFDRRELNLTLGVGLNASFSAFLGYKDSKLDLRDRLVPVVAPLPDPGDLLFVGDRDIEFSYRGGFLGATYAWPVGDSGGSFVVQSSVAVLDAEFREQFTGVVLLTINPLFFVPFDPAGVRPPSRIKGRSVGLNLGVAWTGNLAFLSPRLERVGYTLGVDRSDYEFETSQSSTGNFDERNTRLRLDLRYRFEASR